jgi:hypothetical protein
MTTKKITQLTALTNPVDADVFPIEDTTTVATKKISWTTIKSLLNTYFSTLFTAKNTAITGATKTKITYDAKGLVTDGADATTADISDATNYRYCTDAQKTVIGNTSGTNTGDETAARVGTLISGSSAKDTLVDADLFAASNSASSNVLVKHTWAKLKTGISTLFKGFYSMSSSIVSGAYSTDTYLAGSCITIPTAGGWQAGTQYRLLFDMYKSAAGTAAFVIRIRIGTLGTTSDAVVLTLTFGAGTASIDYGIFELLLNFHSVGANAAISAVARCTHNLAATGLVSTGTAGVGVIRNDDEFDSTTSTKIGVSINGGTSFSGTCSLVQAELRGLSV